MLMLKNRWFQTGLVFILSLALFGAIQFQEPYLAQYDGYYHAAMASDVFSKGFFSQSFPWLYGTSLASAFGDMHLLYHVLLWPFTIFGIIGIKAAVVLYASLAITGLFLFIRSFTEKYALFIIALAMTSGEFLFRLSTPRSMSISIMLILAGLWSLFNKKDLFLGIIMFFFAWTYTGFIFLYGLVLLYIFISWINKENRKKTLIFSSAGLIAGLVTHPYFPSIIKVYFAQIRISLFPVISHGIEWGPASPTMMLKQGFLLLVVLVFALIANMKYSKKRIFLLASTIITFLMYLNSRRSIELLVPISLLFIASSLENIKLRKVTEKTVVMTIGLIILIMISWNLVMLNNVLFTNSPDNYDGCVNWLKKNTPEGTKVFNRRWASFPLLFYKNRHNTYFWGLDPHFTYFNNKEQYVIAENIITGQRPITDIRLLDTEFFLDERNKEFELMNKHLIDEGKIRLSYIDGGCFIARIQDKT